MAPLLQPPHTTVIVRFIHYEFYTCLSYIHLIILTSTLILYLYTFDQIVYIHSAFFDEFDYVCDIVIVVRVF